GLQLSPEAARALEEYSWPGNVRELQNTIERATILCDGKLINREDLNFAFEKRKQAEEFAHMIDLSGSLMDGSNRASQAAEKLKIKQALELSNWNKTQAAEVLDVSYKTLLNKVKEYELEPTKGVENLLGIIGPLISRPRILKCPHMPPMLPVSPR